MKGFLVVVVGLGEIRVGTDILLRVTVGGRVRAAIGLASQVGGELERNSISLRVRGE